MVEQNNDLSNITNNTNNTNINKTIKVRSINNILKNINNDIFIDFARSNNYEEITEKEKLIVKITNNINIINSLISNTIIYDGNIIDNIYDSLKNTNFTENRNNYLIYYKKIKKILGYIVFDMYRYSGYHLLMSNIPIRAISIANNKMDDIDNLENVDSEVITETIEHYIGLNKVDDTLQVSETIFLVKMKDINDSKIVCYLLNKMQISENIIKVELLILLPEFDQPSFIEPKEVEPTTVESQVIETIINPVIEQVVESLIESVNDEYEEMELINSTDMLKSINDNENKNENKNDNDNENKNDNENVNKSSNNSNLLVVDIAYSIFNKISNVFSYFRR